MTRRGAKQEQSAFYAADGNAGEVWALLPEEDDLWSPEVFENQQIAQQYAEWLGRTYYSSGYTPHPRKMRIRTKMKRVD